jgi:Ni,Fe-hydrogenase III small subunit/Pyruvate/2-oxoacid:ferredoxin oxidoreductase delta subunit
MTILDILRARRQQGYRTVAFPPKDAGLSDRYRGRPRLNPERCKAGCRACHEVCPTDAISDRQKLAIDLGRCLFCTGCVHACGHGAIELTQDYRLAARTRSELLDNGQIPLRVRALDASMRGVLDRSLKLRQVSAGGCNACEADNNVLNTPVFDLARFGIQFVASPRHADGLLVTGPVTRNMELALRKTYAAVPSPCLVIAVGTCAISGGPYAGHDEVLGGVDALLPVDLYVPGCPPHPLTILDGLLQLLGRIA